MKDLFLLLLTLFLALKSNAQFAPPVTLADARCFQLSVADFNQDGFDDYATVSFDSANDWEQLIWASNQSDGTFSAPQVIIENDAITGAIAAGDLDGDGWPELLAGHDNAISNDFGLIIFKYDGSGGFVALDTMNLGTTNFLQDIEIFDIDVDGDPDIILLHKGGSQFPSGWLAWFENLGSGEYAPIAFIESGLGQPSEIVIGTSVWDTNEFPDIFLVKSGPNPVQAISMNQSGGFNNPINISTASSSDAVHIQLNGAVEPEPDFTFFETVIMRSNNFSHIWNFQYTTLYSKLIASTTDNLSSSASGDIDLDGKEDLVVSSLDGKVQFMLRNPDNSFGDLTEIEDSPVGSYRIHLSDVDMDGDLDILTTCNSLYSGEGSDEVVLIRNLARDKSISGSVFWDENANGTWDGGEVAIPRFPIKIEPSAFSVFSGDDGQYTIYPAVGNYTISPVLNSCLELTTTPATYNVDFDGNTHIKNLDFGVQAVGTEIEASVNLTSAPTRCSFLVPFWLNIGNEGCTLISGKAFLVKSPLATFQWADLDPTSTSGDTLFWDFVDLIPGETRQVKMHFTIADASFIGEDIFMPAGMISDDGQGGTTQIASYDYQSIVSCAYDPNDKQVYPRRSEHPPFDANYTLFDEQLEYTIRFQNTGTDTAFNIVIRDTLSTDLDLLTFRPGSASHPFETTLHDDGLLEFHFREIMLPDSNVNEPGSHGYVNFNIKAKTGLAENTVIENKVGIYFDFNPPIVTNTVSSTMVETLPNFTPAAAFDFTLTDWIAQFNDLSTNTPTSWLWDFGDGSTGTEQHPAHTYVTPGDYTVCLTAENEWGSNQACQDLMVLTSAEEAFGNIPFIYVYPNPTQGEIWIEKTTDKNIRVTLSGLMGQTMGVYVLSEKTTRISISELPEGVWLLRTTIGATAKVVKL